MSVQAISWGWAQDGLNSSAKLTLLYLCNSANPLNGWACWPSINSICKFTGVSRQGAINALKELEAAGLMEKLVGIDAAVAALDFGISEKKSNVYRLRIPIKASTNDDTKTARLPGFLYVGLSGEFVKIGLTKDIETREKAFATTVPGGCKFVHTIERDIDQIRQLEAKCHEVLAEFRTNGEWFNLPVDKTIEIVNSVDQLLFGNSQESGLDQSTHLTSLVNSVDPNLKETCLNQKEERPKARKRVSYPQTFLDFWASYPSDANMSKKEAFDAWKKLDSEQRRQAIASLPNFNAYCQQNDWYRPIHACRYLRKERFAGFVTGPATGVMDIDEINRQLQA